MRDLQKTLDELVDGLREVNLTLARMDVSIAEHIRRTKAAEDRIEALQAELGPLKNHVAMWAGVAKALVVAGGAMGLLAAVLKALGY